MKQSLQPSKLFILSITSAFLVSCGGGESGSQNVATQSISSGVSKTASETSISSDVSKTASETYTVDVIAGKESGLIKLAQIDGKLAIPSSGDVSIEYSGSALEGTEDGLLGNCEGALNLDNCAVYGNMIFKDPGTYTYTVSYNPRGLFADRASVQGHIIVHPPSDFVVVSIGDSVASGEGNPKILTTSNRPAWWDDMTSDYDFGVDGCHRSSYAGPALAVSDLNIDNQNHNAQQYITFVHIACSGASLYKRNAMSGSAWTYGKIDSVNKQLDWVRSKFNRIDVLIISAGANNIAGGFGTVIEKCVDPKPIYKQCSTDTDFKNELATDIGKLPQRYKELQNKIYYQEDGDDNLILDANGKRIPLPEAEVPSVILITEYHDPTHDANGNFPSNLESKSCELGLISPDEWKFLYDNMVVPLNNAVKQGAIDNNWIYVGGIADAFLKHGYCASPGLFHLASGSWVVKIPQSLNDQGDVQGTGHPDINGQQVYREKIKTALIHANPPRSYALGTSDGKAYLFGSWTANDVEVKLQARNPIFASGVRDTYYSVDGAPCNADSINSGVCQPYSAPFTITESGDHVVSFFSYNNYGAPETRTKAVRVMIDKDPPVMTCSATPDNLWPPNKSMVDIKVSVTAIDAVSGPADYTLVNIQDSAGDVANAVQGFDISTSDTQGSMLADRSGNADDRHYTLTYQSQDALGNVGTCDVVVTVPHDQGKNIKVSMTQ